MVILAYHIPIDKSLAELKPDSRYPSTVGRSSSHSPEIFIDHPVGRTFGRSGDRGDR
jgi:hypothetical protein